MSFDGRDGIRAISTRYSVPSTQYRLAEARTMATIAILVGLASQTALAEHVRRADSGLIRFVPTAAENQVADRFRLAEHEFNWQMQPLWAATENLDISQVT